MSGEIPVVEAGWRAAAALAQTAGRARVLAAFTDSAYLVAGEEIIWLGKPATARHGRAMVTAAPPFPEAAIGESLELDLSGAQLWHPASLEYPLPGPPPFDVLQTVAAELAGQEPPGFGAMLLGGSLKFPLDRASGPARALARACAGDDARAAAEAAVALIGLGPGLTPAGDDFVGGAFFARAQGEPAAGDRRAEWERAGASVVELARGRTHPISLALLSDLVSGHGHAALHELAAAIAFSAADQTLEAARRLVRIGHSSGWDMLAGFVVGLGGP